MSHSPGTPPRGRPAAPSPPEEAHRSARRERAAAERRLVRHLGRCEAELQKARAAVHVIAVGPTGLPGLHPPSSPELVLPIDEAVRRYLSAAALLFEGDPKGLAARLGVSYYALRRLLKRHGVGFPGRARARTVR